MLLDQAVFRTKADNDDFLVAVEYAPRSGLHHVPDGLNNGGRRELDTDRCRLYIDNAFAEIEAVSRDRSFISAQVLLFERLSEAGNAQCQETDQQDVFHVSVHRCGKCSEINEQIPQLINGACARLEKIVISLSNCSNPMKQYHDLLKHILENGTEKGDRTGTGTLSTFGYQSRYDLAKGFPVLTTKKLHLRSIIHELLWFLKGDTNIQYLKENNVSIWDEWADENGDLGPVYGYQWRSWPTPDGQHIDQITNLIESIKKNPDSRRLIVSAWNVAYVDQMALPPCHTMFQFYVADGKLSCQLYQRSADTFLGVPFNIASYALLTMMIAQVCGLQPGEFIHTLGDAHLYTNHLEQAELQLTRDLRPLPQMKINPEVTDIFGFTINDFELVNYDPHPHIKAAVAV